jgi:hypothetical protein
VTVGPLMVARPSDPSVRDRGVLSTIPRNANGARVDARDARGRCIGLGDRTDVGDPRLCE